MRERINEAWRVGKQGEVTQDAYSLCFIMSWGKTITGQLCTLWQMCTFGISLHGMYGKTVSDLSVEEENMHLPGSLPSSVLRWSKFATQGVNFLSLLYYMV